MSEASDHGKPLKAAEQKIMEALGAFYAKGKTSPSKDKIIKVTKMAPKTYANNLTNLKKMEFVVVEGGNPVLTQDGIDFLGPLAQKVGLAKGGATNEEVLENIKSDPDLSKKQRQLIDLISDGEIHDQETIAQSLGYTAQGKKQKAFLNLKGGMRTKELVVYPTKDTIQLDHETCFPFS